MIFKSEVCRVGSIALPEFGGVRILVMPFKLEAVSATMPDFCKAWTPAVEAICDMADVHHGTAYLTIDEAVVPAGETHRRPGLHVDGVGLWGGPALWSAPPPIETEPRPKKKKAAPKPKPTTKPKGGMYLASSHIGCRAWAQDFEGEAGNDGNCEHLANQCRLKYEIIMQPGEVYWCGPLGVHEALPMPASTPRQLIRISMPSKCPWYDGCTPNPLGILPDGPIEPRREKQMGYRP